MLKIFEDRMLLMGLGVLISLIILGLLLYFFVARPALEEKEEVKKEQTRRELLESLTPKNPTPMTTEERRELEELLIKLTPNQ